MAGSDSTWALARPGAVCLTGLEGRTAVVTGAGRMRSIGRSIALALAAAGCDVALTGTGSGGWRTDEEREAGWRDVDSVADEVRALGRAATVVVTDVSDEGSVAALAKRVAEEHGDADIIVNNAAAGSGPDRVEVTDMPMEAWDRVLDINLRGTVLVSRAFAASMRDRGRGCIINISSLAAKTTRAKSSAYAASKAGVVAVTAAMAKELGPYGVRVNAICPGLIATSRSDAAPEAFRQQMISEIPLGRIGTPEDVAAAALFLASDQASWVTGQAWNVDGGQVTMR
jgi:3-oxoacyl-[acyl-carrier protein] reductase